MTSVASHEQRPSGAMIKGWGREEAVEAAVASARIEGFVIEERALDVIEDFAAATIDDAQMKARILDLNGIRS
jgi:hypothetical protein